MNLGIYSERYIPCVSLGVTDSVLISGIVNVLETRQVNFVC